MFRCGLFCFVNVPTSFSISSFVFGKFRGNNFIFKYSNTMDTMDTLFLTSPPYFKFLCLIRFVIILQDLDPFLILSILPEYLTIESIIFQLSYNILFLSFLMDLLLLHCILE